MAKQSAFKEMDRDYVERIGRHIDFPKNDETLKLFKQYRDKLLRRQLALDKKRFVTDELLDTIYQELKLAFPTLDLATPAGAILFAKHVLEAVLEITAYREASMSFMLQIYENELKAKPGKKLKPTLRLIK